jgi:diguanylate cyclase (GGDEF)-like protein
MTATDENNNSGPMTRRSGMSATGLDVNELEKLHILRRVGLESVVGLLENCRMRILEPGETLLEAGQTNQTMYMVLSGRLRVHLENTEGEPVAFLEAGQTVGEISVLDDSPASATVLACERTRLLVVEEETFWRLTEASHEFAVNLLRLLAQRMRANNFTIRETSQQRRQFERDAIVDGLTGLHNRRWLDSTLPRLVQRFLRSGAPLSLQLLDIDFFKKVNDTYGHAAGDHVLRTVARIVVAALRPTDLAARFGGEEFVILLPDTDLDGACVAAERLRSAVAATAIEIPDGRTIGPVTISLGVAELTATDDAAAILWRADEALYRAKEGGRNAVEWLRRP